MYRKPHHSKWGKVEIVGDSVWSLIHLEQRIRKRGHSILWTEYGDLLRSQSTTVSVHYGFVLDVTITVSVEFSYVIRRNVITFKPERKWTAVPFRVCTAYRGEEKYRRFCVSKQNTVCNWKCHFCKVILCAGDWTFFIWNFHFRLNSPWPLCILRFGLMSNFS